MANKVSAKGTKLQLDIATVYTDIGMISINGPEISPEFYDASDLSSGVCLETNTPTGHVTPGSVTGELFYDPADSVHQAIIASMVTPTSEDWKCVYPTTDETAFSGVPKLTPKAARGDGLKGDLEVFLDALPTYPS